MAKQRFIFIYAIIITSVAGCTNLYSCEDEYPKSYLFIDFRPLFDKVPENRQKVKGLAFTFWSILQICITRATITN